MGTMTLKIKFWRWTLLFGALGLLVPAAVCSRYFLFGSTSELGGLLGWLWPSSFIFMALDVPNPNIFEIVLTYAIALIVNFVLYAAVGAVAWPFVLLVLRLRDVYGGRRKPH